MANLPGSIKNLNTLLGEQLLDGGGSGGGGSSDFSTAEVTFEHAEGSAVYIEIPHIFKTPTNEEFIDFHYNPTKGTSVLNTILYKGLAYMEDPDQKVQSVSGSIESLGDGGYYITGGCTITIS